jgi:hypothetical protein
LVTEVVKEVERIDDSFRDQIVRSVDEGPKQFLLLLDIQVRNDVVGLQERVAPHLRSDVVWMEYIKTLL